MGASGIVFPESLGSKGLVAAISSVVGMSSFGIGLEEDVLRRSRRDLAWASMLEAYMIEKLHRMLGEERQTEQGLVMSRRVGRRETATAEFSEDHRKFWI